MGGYIGVILAVVIGAGLAGWGISTLMPPIFDMAEDDDEDRNWWDQ